MEQKFSQIDGITGSIEDNWGKVKETLMDIQELPNFNIKAKPGKV